MPDSHSEPTPQRPTAAGRRHDRDDAEMRRQVRPDGWRDPTPAPRHDLVILGGGTAGLVTARGAASLGARVALIEADLLGGDCLVHGCVPSKALLRSARAWHEVEHGAVHGAPPATAPGDFAAAMARMRRLRAEISHHDDARRLAALGVDVFFGRGGFAASDAVQVDGHRLRFRRALIATGARPLRLEIPGLEATGFLTHRTVFDLEILPRRLVVVGGGPVGCELAQAFARFGSEVTLIQRADQLLPHDDPDAAEALRDALEADGVRCLLGTELVATETGEGQHRLHLRSSAGETSVLEIDVKSDRILVAAGRSPNVEGLGLEAAGIEYDPQGIPTNDFLRTSNRRVFAAGDVLGGRQFTHLAEAQARIVLRNALFPFGRRRASRLVLPWCTYTSPAVAHVGIETRRIREQGLEMETLTLPLDRVDRPILDGATRGFLRLHLDPGSDRIVGATVVAEDAGEIIATLALAITHGLGLSALGATVLPYPTAAELLKRAADERLLRRLAPWVPTVLARYFRWTRRG